MANIRAHLLLVRSIIVSTDGRPMKAGSWLQQSRRSMDSSSTSRARMTIPCLSGTLQIQMTPPIPRLRPMIINSLSLCKNLLHTRRSHLDRIMQRIVDVALPFCAHSLKSMVLKQRCSILIAITQSCMPNLEGILRHLPHEKRFCSMDIVSVEVNYNVLQLMLYR